MTSPPIESSTLPNRSQIGALAMVALDWAKRLSPLALPLLLLLPGIWGFPYPSAQAAFSDISIAHYPYAVFLKQALFNEHRLPLWSPLILSGHPFAANPLSGMWYPPGWLALLLPLPFGFNLLVLLHLLWGGIGLYGLLRSEGLPHRPALFAALAFIALPKLWAHYGAGHLTLLYTAPWTPWLLWAARAARQKPSTGLPWREGAILALIFLADVRWSLFAGLLRCTYGLAHHRISLDRSRLASLWESARHLAGQALLALLLVAPLALPLAQFALHSTRSQMEAGDVLSYSLPFVRLLGLLFPDFGGFHEWMLYSGAALLVLALVVLATGSSHSNGGFWWWAAGGSLLFSFGSQLPLLPLLARLPGFDLLRVPARALLITGLALAALSAYGVHRLQLGLTSADRRRVTLLLTGLLGFVLTLTLGVWYLTGNLAPNFAWGAAFLILAALLVLARARHWIVEGPWFLLLVLICLIDLWGVDWTLFDARQPSAVLSEGQPVAQWIASQNGDFRVYSPSYSLPQQTAARYRLQLADGVDPLQLQPYVTFMAHATGVPNPGYSVTLPPFANGQPVSDNAGYSPDPHSLGLLNVRYVASHFDLEIPGLEWVTQIGETRLYLNQEVYPRAWLQGSETNRSEAVTPVSIQYWNSDRIILQAEGAGLLVLSELAYPGWQVRVDGRTQPLETAYGLLRAVRLDGTDLQQVEFVFRPFNLYLGCLISLITILFWVAYPRLRRRWSRLP